MRILRANKGPFRERPFFPSVRHASDTFPSCRASSNRPTFVLMTFCSVVTSSLPSPSRDPDLRTLIGTVKLSLS